jgi:hypothetical protein
VGVAHQTGGFFRLDVKVARKLHRSREQTTHSTVCCRSALLARDLGARGAARDIEREDHCLGGALGTVHCLGGASGKAISLFSLEFSTYNRDTTLEEYRDGFQCSHHVGSFRVERG